MTSPNDNACDRCGQALLAQSPGGICPTCLMGEALGSIESLNTEGLRHDKDTDPGRPEQMMGFDSLEGTCLADGRYKLLQRIGEGGFGTVYMAEQSKPMRRRVAIKILKAGMDTRQVVARFEAERQALAMMDHPNIAKILDGGETEQGRPFFVMELVRGTPITTFCDREELDTPTRLNLFLEVCAAVQHAHQKGIIHRDLKPGNILISMPDGADPVPKVIDFGVAKAMDTPLTDKTLFTRFEQMIGTPAYMSPEQAGSEGGPDIDTRADIYALGVLLYELLTGTTPFEAATMQHAAFDEVRRILHEDDAPRPSARLSSLEQERLTTIAKGRATESMTLRKQLRGDLDWIVMHAIEKDRKRRYETANALAADIERHLRDEPVSAGPPTVAYRTGKFLRRHRTSVATAALLMTAVLVGLALTSVGFLRAKKESDRAQAAEEKMADQVAIATAINDFLTRDLLAQAGPEETPDRDLKLRVAVDRAARNVAQRFHDQPLVEADVHMTIASIYAQVGEEMDARDHALRAAEIWERELGSEHQKTLKARALYASTGSRDYGDVKSLLSIIERQRERLGRDHPDTLESVHRLTLMPSNIGPIASLISKQIGKLPNPEMLEGEAKYHALMARLIAHTYWKSPVAIDTARRAVAEIETEFGPLHPTTLNAQKRLGGFLIKSPGSEIAREVEDLFEQLVPRMRATLGPAHPTTVSTLRSLAKIKGRHLSKPAEALRIERQLLDSLVAERGELDPESILQLNRVVGASNTFHRESGETVEELGNRVLGEFGKRVADLESQLLSSQLSEGEPDAAKSLVRLGDVFSILLNSIPRAVPAWASLKASRMACYRRAIGLQESGVHIDPWAHSTAYTRLGRIHLSELNRSADLHASVAAAESHCVRALELLKGDEHAGLRNTCIQGGDLVRLYSLTGRKEKSVALLRDIIEEDLELGNWYEPALKAYISLGEFSQACDYYLQAAGQSHSPAGWFPESRGAVCALLADDLERYEQFCNLAFARAHADRSNSVLRSQSALVALLAPGNSERIARAVELVPKLLMEEGQGAMSSSSWYMFPAYTAVLAAYRTGDYRRVEELLDIYFSENGGGFDAAAMGAILALVKHRTGDHVAARDEMNTAWKMAEEARSIRVVNWDALHSRPGLNEFWFNHSRGDIWYLSTAPIAILVAEARREIEGSEAARNLSNRHFWNAHEQLMSIPDGSETVVARGATWKFLHPHDGVDPVGSDEDFHTTFFQPAYDDSGWVSDTESARKDGWSGFGYGKPVDVQWTRPEEGDRKSAYFRHRFQTSKKFERLWLRMICDDGAIIYLDGNEVGRVRVDRGAAESFGLTAKIAQGINFGLHANLSNIFFEGAMGSVLLGADIEPGDHVLAISLHNRATDSSDLYIRNIQVFGIPDENPVETNPIRSMEPNTSP